MVSPKPPEQLPLDEEQENTYPELLQKLQCSISGALITPTGLHPSAAINIGDVIAAHAAQLTSVVNSYSYFLIILEMIGCIIDVLCAIPNPFSTISAMIRLFGTCLPNLLLLFPAFTLPAIILCFIKIVLSIIEYILTVIIPIIEDITNNIINLNEAFAKGNPDAQSAIAFKLAGLIKELYSVIGIMVALVALFELIKAMLQLGLGLPCGGGSSCCNEENCPDVIKQETVEGTDGFLYLYFVNDFDYDIRFSSQIRQDEFQIIRNFLPQGINYNSIERENIPYIIRVSGDDYIVNAIDTDGTLDLLQTPNEFLQDGYLSNRVVTGVILDQIIVGTLSDPDIRFATKTPTFDSSFVASFNSSSFLGRRFIELQELRSQDTNPDSDINNGTFEIKSTVLSVSSVLDEYNVILTRTDGESWDGYSILAPGPHIRWRLRPSYPRSGSNKSFSLQINHEELIRRQMIGYGCHPAVDLENKALQARFPNINEQLPDIPDLNNLINQLNNTLGACFPQSVDSQYVLDNYNNIANCSIGLENNISNLLNDFADELTDYAGNIYSQIFDPETSLFSATPVIQTIGETVVVSVTPLNKSGLILSADLPPGVIEVNIYADAGNITTPLEVFDAYGVTTGEFRSELTSNIPTTISLTARVAGISIADFNGTNLVERTIVVRFVTPEKRRSLAITGEIPEPLGAE